MKFFAFLTPEEAGLKLAERIKVLRLERGWTRKTMAERAGVTASSLKRFETAGKASLDLLLKVTHALGRLDDFREILEPPPARSIDELEALTLRRARKRGRA